MRQFSVFIAPSCFGAVCILESGWLYGEQFAVPYFFAVNFAPQYLMGGAGGKFFNVACYVTYDRMACGTLSISEDGKVEKKNLFLERYMSCTGE